MEMETEMIRFKPEVKKILDAIDNLTPWDKIDLHGYLIDTAENTNIIDECLSALGYVDFNDIDLVDEIVKNGMEENVLDTMSDWEIAEYACRNNLHEDILADVDVDDLVDILYRRRDEDFLTEFLDELYEKHPEILIKYLDEKSFDKSVKYKVTKKGED